MKRIVGLISCLVIFFTTNLLPVPSGLDIAGRNTLALLLIALILWILEIVPLGITSIFLLALQPIMGITDIGTSMSSFGHPVVFFVIATFGISITITKVPLAKRMLIKILDKLGDNVNNVILAFMIATALISTVMSNIPATGLFMGIALGFLEVFNNEEDRKKTGRALMIAIPVAGMIGGIMTPVGSSINILSLSLLSEYTGINISFINWMLIGVPIGLILLPLAWFIIIKLYKPININKVTIDKFLETQTIDAKLSKEEWKVFIILIAMLVFWIASSWISGLNVTIVAICGLIVMFLPGIDILDWNTYSKGVNWSVMLMVGSVLSIGNAVMSNGVGQWLLDNIFIISPDTNVIFVLIFLGIFIALLHLPLPIAPAIVTVMSYPLIGIASSMGINPSILIIPLAMYSGWCMLLPVDPVPLLTYSTGYYSMSDMAKGGSIITFAGILITSIWIPIIYALI